MHCFVSPFVSSDTFTIHGAILDQLVSQSKGDLLMRRGLLIGTIFSQLIDWQWVIFCRLRSTIPACLRGRQGAIVYLVRGLIHNAKNVRARYSGTPLCLLLSSMYVVRDRTGARSSGVCVTPPPIASSSDNVVSCMHV